MAPGGTDQRGQNRFVDRECRRSVWTTVGARTPDVMPADRYVLRTVIDLDLVLPATSCAVAVILCLPTDSENVTR